MPCLRRHLSCSLAEGRNHIYFASISLGQIHSRPGRGCEGGRSRPHCPCVMRLALPVSGFMTYIVEPLFQEWARFTGNSALSENMLSHLARNKAQWKSLLPKQHRSSGGGCAGGSPDHTDHGTENEEQTVTEGIAP